MYGQHGFTCCVMSLTYMSLFKAKCTESVSSNRMHYHYFCPFPPDVKFVVQKGYCLLMQEFGNESKCGSYSFLSLPS